MSLVNEYTWVRMGKTYPAQCDIGTIGCGDLSTEIVGLSSKLLAFVSNFFELLLQSLKSYELCKILGILVVEFVEALLQGLVILEGPSVERSEFD